MSWGPGAIRPLTTVKFVRTSPLAILPARAHEHDAAYDLYSADCIEIWPQETKLIDTGFKVAVPNGYVGLVCSRSGLAANKSVFVLNSPGVIDAGYRGALKVILRNEGTEPFRVEIGDRIAQLMLQRAIEYRVLETDEFRDSTERGEGGFGSTGLG